MAIPKTDVFAEEPLYGLQNLIRGTCGDMQAIADEFIRTTNASCVVMNGEIDHVDVNYTMYQSSQNGSNFQYGLGFCRKTPKNFINNAAKFLHLDSVTNQWLQKPQLWRYMYAAGTNMIKDPNNHLKPYEKEDDDILTNIMNKIAKGVETGYNEMVKGINTAGRAVVTGVNVVKDTAVNTANDVANFGVNAFEGTKKIGVLIKDTTANAAKDAVKFTVKTTNVAVTAVGNAANGVAQFGVKTFEDTKKVGQTVGKTVQNAFNTAGQGVQTAQRGIQQVEHKVAAIAQGASNKVVQGAQTIQRGAGNVVNGAKHELEKGISTVGRVFGNLFG